MASPAMIELLKQVRVPLERNGVSPGDNVLIVADAVTEPLIWEGLAAAAYLMGAEPSIAIMTPRDYDYQDPPAPIADAMLKADLVILVPRKTWLIHSDACGRAMRSGVPIICMEQTTTDMLIKHAGIDWDAVQSIADRLATFLDPAETVHVTSELGTDLQMSVAGRKSLPLAARILKQGHFYSCAYPDGETAIPPVEGTASGTVVVDEIASMLGPIRGEPLKFEIRDGRLEKIDGGSQAEELTKILEQHGDENSRTFAEFAFGTNPDAQLVGIIRSDKKKLGYIHVAVGRNIDFGGETHSKIHLDFVLSKCTVVVDDRQIFSAGRLVAS